MRFGVQVRDIPKAAGKLENILSFLKVAHLGQGRGWDTVAWSLMWVIRHAAEACPSSRKRLACLREELHKRAMTVACKEQEEEGRMRWRCGLAISFGEQRARGKLHIRARLRSISRTMTLGISGNNQTMRKKKEKRKVIEDALQVH